jgi:hypothetical protein
MWRKSSQPACVYVCGHSINKWCQVLQKSCLRHDSQSVYGINCEIDTSQIFCLCCAVKWTEAGIQAKPQERHKSLLGLSGVQYIDRVLQVRPRLVSELPFLLSCPSYPGITTEGFRRNKWVDTKQQRLKNQQNNWNNAIKPWMNLHWRCWARFSWATNHCRLRIHKGAPSEHCSMAQILVRVTV